VRFRRPAPLGFRFLLPAIALLGIGPASNVSAAITSKAERKIVTAVDRHTPAALELLRRTVDVNSGTMNPDGVREVGRIFGAEFEALGFKFQWVDGAPWGRVQRAFRAKTGLDNQAGWDFTWPSSLPWPLRLPLDHVLARGHLVVTKFAAGPEIDSDHLPVIAEIGWRD